MRSLCRRFVRRASPAAPSSSVTLFGVVGAAVRHVKNGDSSLASGGVNSSRLGVRGTEELGGGPSDGFWLEHGFNVDCGTQTDANRYRNRRSTVSLVSSLGEIRLGRDFTPTYTGHADYDPFGDNGVGASSKFDSSLEGDDAAAAAAIERVREDDPWVAVRMALARHFGLTKLEALCVDPVDGLRPWGLVIGRNPFDSQIRLSAARAIPARDEAMFFAQASATTLEALRLGSKWAFRAREPLLSALADRAST